MTTSGASWRGCYTDVVRAGAFAKSGCKYAPPRLVLYSGVTPMPGGMAQAAYAPFYLPADQTINLDFSFFEQMKGQFGMPGDFAAAYVPTHEVGHHVQHLLGLTNPVQGRMPEARRNQMSVRLELQADFPAGAWAHHARRRWDILDEGGMSRRRSTRPRRWAVIACQR